MDPVPEFNKYMEGYYDYLGQWDSPSRCGIRTFKRKDGKILIIVTELYRLNPGTSITEWCAPLATRLMNENHATFENLIYIEHTPDYGSKLEFRQETFDQVSFNHEKDQLTNPCWTRLSKEEVDALLEE
ncbi:MAG: hypothetical protein Q8867_06240 [Bacteroidota bacterium]|nr:hypothetical protein [Bacteroidota bacterium]